MRTLRVRYALSASSARLSIRCACTPWAIAPENWKREHCRGMSVDSQIPGKLSSILHQSNQREPSTATAHRPERRSKVALCNRLGHVSAAQWRRGKVDAPSPIDMGAESQIVCIEMRASKSPKPVAYEAKQSRATIIVCDSSMRYTPYTTALAIGLSFGNEA